MILNILKYPNPLLRKKSEEIKEITPQIKQLALDMVDAMVANKGLGLAAPQVGELKRIITVHLVADRSSEEKLIIKPQILINPKVIKKSRKTGTDEEGCLCLPGLYLKIKRAEDVEVEALDINGEEIRIETKGLPARVLQHEIDHLDGVLFIDKIGFWEKLKLKRKLKNAAN